MNTEKFTQIYNESRNGANEFYRHWATSKFAYSDGVRDCAECGIYWLIDIAATELPAILRDCDEHLGVLTASVKAGKARLRMTGSCDLALWSKKIDWTDLPDGDWVFYIGDDGPRHTMILTSEY